MNFRLSLMISLSLSRLLAFGGDHAEQEVAAAQKAATASSSTWGWSIPYQNDCAVGTFNPYSQCTNAVNAAVAKWNARVPFLRLVKRTTEADYIAFLSNGGLEGSSQVGRKTGRQNIYIPEVPQLSIMVRATLHEVAHAAGMSHEQSRQDRDWFIELNGGNISDIHQFQVGATGGWDVGSYDFNSIMHYLPSECQLFARNPLDWVVKKRTGVLTWGGESADILTNGDVYALHQMAFPDWSRTADVEVALSGNRPGTPSGPLRNEFAPARKVNDFFCLPGEDCHLGDVDGNGKADLVLFNHGRNGATMVNVSLNDGSGFAQPYRAHAYFCIGSEVCAVGDVNGDHRADLVAFQHGRSLFGSGRTQVWVSYARQDAPGFFESPVLVSSDFCGSVYEECLLGDLDGNRVLDLVAINRWSGQVNVLRANRKPTGFTLEPIPPPFMPLEAWGKVMLPIGTESTSVMKLGDADGDGKAELIYFDRGNSGVVRYATARPPFGVGRLGIIVAGSFSPFRIANSWFCVYDESCEISDINGDGLNDIVAFNRANGLVWGAQGSRSFAGTLSFVDARVWHWGFCRDDDACLTGDVNADGAADLVAFRR